MSRSTNPHGAVTRKLRRRSWKAGWRSTTAALALAAAGAAKAAPLPLAPQQLELCRLHYAYTNDNAAYQRAQRTMNSIQQASAPPPPKREDYAVKFARYVGPSGDFNDWTGTISFLADTSNRTVRLDIEFPCPPSTNPVNAGRGFLQLTPSASVRNTLIQARSPWEQYLSANGYAGIPLDGQMAAGLAQIPNDGRAHYVRFSGTLLYLPSVAGPSAFPTYARPGTSPDYFNVDDMMLAFRITSLTLFR